MRHYELVVVLSPMISPDEASQAWERIKGYEVYHRQFEDNEVLVCLDETSKQQVRETGDSQTAKPT